MPLTCDIFTDISEVKMENSKRTIRIFWDVIWFLLFAGSFIFIWWKCRYGFGNIDESFYLTIPYRLVQGDGLFVHEWHVSQLSGFLLYPIMQIYMMIVGHTEGMLLAFRYIFVLVQSIASAFIYFRLRRIGQPAAVIASIVFMLYVPFGIMALSYNSMGIINLTISLVILLTARKVPRLQYAFAGAFFAMAVLCNPYLISEYFLWFIAVVIYSIVRRGKEPREVLLTFRCWLFFTIGAAIIAAAFAVFVLSRASLAQITAAFPYILNDPDHTTGGPVNLIVTYFTSILFANKISSIGYALVLVLTIVAAIDRKNAVRRAVYFICAAVFTIVIVFITAFVDGYLNFIMFPLNIMGLFCAVLSWKELTRRVLCAVWLPGMIYSLCLHASSNQTFYAISSASTVPLVGSIMIIFLCAADIAREKSGSLRSIATVAAFLLFVSLMVNEGILRYKTVFWEEMNTLQSTPQNAGVEKGLLLSNPAADLYRDTLSLKSYIDKNYPDAEYVTFCSNYTWMYLLNSGRRNASFSAWQSDLNGVITDGNFRKMSEYYRLNPDRIPDLVYLERGYGGYIHYFTDLYDYSFDDLSGGAIILYR